VLYVTLSPYLAQGALVLYGAHGFENPAQEAQFLSFRELLETLHVPPGCEVDLRSFRGWFERHRQAVRALGEINAHALFEEFRGVIGAQSGGPLALADYLALALKAFDAASPSTKPRQAMLDYALWHGRQRWIERLAAVGVPAARSLVADGEFLGAGWQDTRDVRVPSWAQGELLVRRTVAALRQRHLQPYAARNFKEVLRQADVHGVDHRTPAGATALMLAARAGNAPLVRALLDKGADAAVHDEFGHTAWLFAVSRALEEPEFARAGLPAGAVRSARACGHGRAGRWAPGAHRAPPGTILAAHVDAGGFEDAVVALRTPAAGALEVPGRLLCGATAGRA
jgi:hypothetical protein